MTRSNLFSGISITLVVFVSPAAAQSPAVDPSAEAIFALRVWPVLREKCLACHGEDPKKIKGGLDLSSRDKLLRGGDGGQPGVIAGKPTASPLYRAVLRKDNDYSPMPPKEKEALTQAEIAAFAAWIEAGSPWPSAERIAEITRTQKARGVLVKTSGGLSPEWTNRPYQSEDLWAYRPLGKHAPPDAKVHPIDAFLRTKLQQEGFTPAPGADRATLIRRVTIDLTGLPPTADEIEAFVRDQDPAAFKRLVDRLLDSPRYAEQQARHWLDVARYADTAGFSNDFERPNAWRYRDYVVRAFQYDKPYDRFVLEQLAGDELAPEDPEALLAVGFLRMGPWEHTGMTVAAVTRQQWLDDVTNSVGVTFLGQGLRCAACHDHKFDPLPTRDYYRIQAAFATTYLAERTVPFLAAENVAGAKSSCDLILSRLNEVKHNQAGLQKKAASLLDKVETTLRKVYSKSKQYFERELLRFEPYALSVYTGPDNGYFSPRAVNPVPEPKTAKAAETFILKGGSLEAPGDKVEPGILSVVALLSDAGAKTTLPAEPEGRRLALARWIVGEGRALAARVLVNRVWQQHFGAGLVATPNNFGKMGARPSHPELLDWLAHRFIEDGWSIKKLHRLILTSSAYQQSSVHADIKTLQRADPKNRWLAYYAARRLAAEEIRDALLLASGELNLQAGGPGFFPEINWEVALQPRHVMGSVAPAYIPSLTPMERNRRALYAIRIRTLADPMLEVFNRPGSELSCERRDETIVASQALTLFNGAFTHQRALAVADAVQRDSAKGKSIETVFRRVLGRVPTPQEQQWSEEHVAAMEKHHAKHPPRKVSVPTKVRREFIEELVGELVSWDEELTPLRAYQPGLQAWQISARTRALAELALVLMNSNEFLTVR